MQPKKYFKWTTECECNGHKLPMVAVVISCWQSHSSRLDILKDNSTYDYSYTMNILSLIHQWRLLIYITIDNGSNNTVGGSCYSAHQDGSKFAEHHIDMVSGVHRKCQTRTGVLGNINKLFECVAITDSKFLRELCTYESRQRAHP